jgi:hypothetical protein
MAFDQRFADWYRSAALTPPEGLLEKRWGGVQSAIKKPKAAFVIDLAKLFTIANVSESAVPAGFRDSFRSVDEAFPSKDNLQEMRVLAGAVLRMIIEERHSLAPLAALALVCGSFGPREATLPEREHFEIAERFLIEYSTDFRRSGPLSVIKIPNLSKERFTELLQPNVFTQNQLPQLQEPLLNALAAGGLEITTALKNAQKAIEQLSHTVQVRDEEVNILWWLQTCYSRALQKSFSETGYAAGTLVFPNEVADLTLFVPGSESVIAVLVHALQLAGAPSISETITIAHATNATPREWRERICSSGDLGETKILCPILLAIHKSLDTEGRDDWLPVYRKACDVPVDQPLPLIRLASQLFRERMFLKALAEGE